MSRRRWFTVIAAVVVVIGASAGVVQVWPERTPRSQACDREVEDRLDPRSLQHVLAGAPPPTYATEPPTSGPHQPNAITGVVTEPLSGPLQVGALEGGKVLLQHRNLAPADRGRLEAMGGPLVVVAPNPVLPVPVVASAWRTRRLCRGVDADALGRFVADHAGRDPAHAG